MPNSRRCKGFPHGTGNSSVATSAGQRDAILGVESGKLRSSALDGSIDISFNSDGWGLHPQEVIGPSNFTSNNAVHFDDTDNDGEEYCYTQP